MWQRWLQSVPCHGDRSLVIFPPRARDTDGLEEVSRGGLDGLAVRR